jgi:FemAB-related protein (PEP-CTERM system-associated)
MMKLDVRQVDNEAAGEWDAFVSNSPGASHYHQYAWRHFFSDVFGKESYYLAAYKGDSIVGVLPLVRQKSWLFGDYLVSLPFLNYGGILSEDDQVHARLAKSLGELAGRLGVSHAELREFSDQPDLASRTDKVTMHLQLPKSADELSKKLGSKRRSQIRRPVREGPTVSTGGIELLDRFYAVFSRNMRDIGTPVYPKRMFADILERFADDTTIVLVDLNGEPAAAAFLLHFRNKTEVPWASTDRRFNKISINMFLYWQLLTYAIERGSDVFDFGRSSVDSGTYRFKAQWGAEPVQLIWNYWLGHGQEVPRMNPDNPKYARAISAWQRLPVAVANLLGPHIVSKLP